MFFKKVDITHSLDDVSSSHYFHLVNGQNIRNLYELLGALKNMDDSEYDYHVTKTKNDFANWIKDIIKDEELASDISKLNKIKKTIKLLQKRIETAEKQREELVRKAEKEIKAEEKAEVSELPPIHTHSPSKDNVAEILEREKEIQLKEEKIREIEERIEKKLEESRQEKGFFNKEFMQGFVVGFLLCAIIALAYLKFFLNLF